MTGIHVHRHDCAERGLLLSLRMQQKNFYVCVISFSARHHLLDARQWASKQNKSPAHNDKTLVQYTARKINTIFNGTSSCYGGYHPGIFGVICKQGPRPFPRWHLFDEAIIQNPYNINLIASTLVCNTHSIRTSSWSRVLYKNFSSHKVVVNLFFHKIN